MPSRAVSRYAVAVSVVLAGFVAVLEPAAARELTFTTRQVTTTSSGVADEVTINTAGDTLAFISTGNIGNNPDGNPEVYVAFAFGGAPTQITNTAGSIQAHPLINADGNVLIFQSTAGLDPQVSNSDGSAETFRIDDWWVPGAAFQQLTLNPSGSISAPAPEGRASLASSSADGDLVVFSSRGAFPGASNPENNSEIYLYDRVDGLYYQVTSTGAGVENLHPVIDEDGLGIAYVSNADGNYEVYMVTVDETIVDEEDECLTDPTIPGCSNGAPVMTITPAGNQTVNEGETLTLAVTASDPEFDDIALTVQMADGSPISTTGATFRLNADDCDPAFDDCDCDPAVEQCFMPSDVTATFTWQPGYDRGGQDYQFVFNALDDFGAQSSQMVAVTVIHVNRSPTLSVSPKSGSVKVGLPVTISLTGSDLDTGSALTINGPAGAYTPSPCAGTSPLRCSFVWTPSAGDLGTATLTFTVTDPEGASTAVDAVFTVVLNNLPVITTGSATATERECFTLTIRATDKDKDPLIFDVDPSTLPAGSVFLRGTATLHWHPGTDISNSTTNTQLTLRAIVSDMTDTVTRDIVITVLDSPDDQASFPNKSSVTVTVAPGATANLSVLAWNTGFSTWTGGSYALMPDYMTSGLTPPAAVALGGSVAPGGTYTFTVPVQAPTRIGSYTLRFKMSRDGTLFGTTSNTYYLKVQ